jgi:hypothetical protein
VIILVVGAIKHIIYDVVKNKKTPLKSIYWKDGIGHSCN